MTRKKQEEAKFKKMPKVRAEDVHEKLRELHQYISCLGQLSPGARKKLLNELKKASDEYERRLAESIKGTEFEGKEVENSGI